ncbi:unnamed protein product [Rotaria socialis]
MDNYNTTLEFCVNNISNGKSLFISNITLHICGFICIIIGLPGHIFHFIALLIKTNRNDPNTLYLIATMICDLIFVIELLISKIWIWQPCPEHTKHTYSASPISSTSLQCLEYYST